jgi:ribose transport system substrate-binding protein
MMSFPMRRGTRRLLLAIPVLAALALTASCSNVGSSVSGDTAGKVDGKYAAILKDATTPYPAQFTGPGQPVAPPKHVKVGIVTCNSILSGCVSPANGTVQAAKTLGWQVRIFDGGGSADVQNSQMLNALSWGANIVLNIAIDPSSVQIGLSAAKRKGVPVGAGSNGLDSPNPAVRPAPGQLGYAFDVAPDYAALGKKAAKWINGNSRGKAKVAVYSDKEFPSVLALQNGLLAGLKQCSGCTVQPLQYFTGDQVAQILPQSIVGYLRAHSDINYVFLPYDPAAAAVVPAIAQAGLANSVQVISVLGSQQNLGFIRTGHVEVADAAYDNQYMGYAMLDQAARMLTRRPLADPQGENLPFVVLDKSNVPQAGADWHATFSYQNQFATLWNG